MSFGATCKNYFHKFLLLQLLQLQEQPSNCGSEKNWIYGTCNGVLQTVQEGLPLEKSANVVWENACSEPNDEFCHIDIWCVH